MNWIMRKIRANKKAEQNKQIALNRNIATLIQDFYVNKNLEEGRATGKPFAESWDNAVKELLDLRITSISFKKEIITIRLSRCGLLIGRRGSNINALEDFLRKTIKFKELNIEEERVLDYLIPMTSSAIEAVTTGEY